MKLLWYTPHSIDAALVCSEKAYWLMEQIVKDYDSVIPLLYNEHPLYKELIEEHQQTLAKIKEDMNGMLLECLPAEDFFPPHLTPDTPAIFMPDEDLQADGVLVYGIELADGELEHSWQRAAIMEFLRSELDYTNEEVKYQDKIWSSFVQD